MAKRANSLDEPLLLGKNEVGPALGSEDSFGEANENLPRIELEGAASMSSGILSDLTLARKIERRIAKNEIEFPPLPRQLRKKPQLNFDGNIFWHESLKIRFEVRKKISLSFKE